MVHQAQIPLTYARQQRFGQEAHLSLPPLRACYTRTFELTGPVTDIDFVFEDQALRAQRWALHVNACTFTEHDVRDSQRFASGTQAIAIAAALQAGHNKIVLELDCVRADDGLLAACFISGDFFCRKDVFGIAQEDPTVAASLSDAVIDFNDLNSVGCHYYDGILFYTATILLSWAPETTQLIIDCSHLVGEAFELQINDGAWYPVLWAPRRVCIPVETLRQGENRCVVKRLGSLGRCYDGEIFDYACHQRLPVEVRHLLGAES